MQQALGLFLLRLTAGGIMLAAHGWPKLINFTQRMDTFPDPLNIGSPLSLAMVVFAEFFCAFFIVIGLITKLSTIPLIICMAVAAFVIHGNDPFKDMELAVVFMMMYVVIFFVGPGQWSVDQMVKGSKRL